MGIGGIETGVRDIAKYLNKKKIDNYILCENSNKNFNVKGLKIIASMGIGGIETGVRDIAKYINKKKIDNYILCESSNKNFDIKGLKIIKLNNLKFKNIFDQNKIKNQINQLIKQKRINLVHISSRAPAFFLIKYIKNLNIKVVTSVHNKYESKSILKDWYNSFLLKGDAIIFNSNFVKKTYEHKFNDKTKLHVIPRGVDTNYFSPSRKKLISKNIFIPSRISSWKGHELLLNYFSLLQQKHKDTFNIHIVSLNKSKEEKKIQLLINKLNISKKIIIHKPTLDVKKLYQGAYLVVNISKRPEGFGRTVSEALSVTKVVIAPNQGGTKEQLFNFNKNLLFDVNSFKSFQKTFKYALKNYKEISKKGRSYVEKNYSSDLMCRKTLDIYNHLINS